MKRIIFISLLFLIIGCGSTQFYIRPGSDLNAYKYVFIKPLQNDSYNTYDKLASLFNKEGFIVVEENKINSLPGNERVKMLICKYSLTKTQENTIALIELRDYATKKIIFSSAGKYQEKNDKKSESLGALKKSFDAIKKKYNGFSVIAVRDTGYEKNIPVKKADLEKYYDMNLNQLNTIEGIWSSIQNDYTIGIFKDTLSSKRNFVAIILNSEKPEWKPGDVKIEFMSTVYPTLYTTTYFLADRSKQGTTSELIDNGILEISLRNPKNNMPFKTKFIKNYPKITDTEYGESIKETQTSGSGFLIGQNGLIVSNFHVVKNSKKIEVFFPKKDKTYQAKIILKDIKNDIVLLRIEEENFSTQFDLTIPFALGNPSAIKVGQNVFTIGYPLEEILGKSPKLSIGVINSLNGINDDPRLLQISNPVQPGNSGGPLFNSNGEIVGIVVATLNAKYFYEKIEVIPQNVNFAIKIGYLKTLVSMLPESDDILNRKSSLVNKSLEKQVEKIAPFVVIVKAY